MSSRGQPLWSFCPNSGLQVNSVAISDDGNRCVFGTSFERGNGNFATFVIENASTSTMQINSLPISDGVTTQGVFWVDISGDGNYIASGGQTSETNGFVYVYPTENSDKLLNVALDSRANQVSLSQNGDYLAFCTETSVWVYQLNATGDGYTQIFTESFAEFSLNSCMLSRDGTTLVVSGINYGEHNNTAGDTSTTGQVASYDINQDKVTLLGKCPLAVGSMRVAIVDTGAYWAASLHDGSCVLIDRLAPEITQWHYTPEVSNISLAYAVAITQTDEGKVFVACGANVNDTQNGGCLYLVESILVTYSKADYQGQKYIAEPKWSSTIKRPVNPGVSMDKNAQYVTATDGKPKGQTVDESAGSFYLFDASLGDCLWTHPTSMMNWPMMLSKDGTSVMGGSDQGHVYYWKTPSS